LPCKHDYDSILTLQTVILSRLDDAEALSVTANLPWIEISKSIEGLLKSKKI
jgi:hypothetical protein